MTVASEPLPVALRVGGRVVLGFHVYEYDGLTFGAAALIIGPPSSYVHLGVRRRLFDLVDDVCHSVFGASLPALVSLEVGLLSKIDEKVLGGKLDDGREAVTTMAVRGELRKLPFSPNHSVEAVKCAGETEWRRGDKLCWYSLSLLRPWFDAPLERTDSNRRVSDHFKNMSHNAHHAQNRLGKPAGKASGQNRPGWHAWALMGYRLLPEGAIDRAGTSIPEQGLSEVAQRERLPWDSSGGGLDGVSDGRRPSEEVSACFLAPLDAGTTAAIARRNAAARAANAAARAAVGASAANFSRHVNGRPGDVLWLLSATGPRLVLSLGKTSWGGGSEKGGLMLKTLPTTEGGSADGGLPYLLQPEELTPDECAPINHVVPFARLLDMEWCRPAPPGGIGGDAASLGSSPPAAQSRPVEAAEATGGAALPEGGSSSIADATVALGSGADAGGATSSAVPFGGVAHATGAATELSSRWPDGEWGALGVDAGELRAALSDLRAAAAQFRSMRGHDVSKPGFALQLYEKVMSVGKMLEPVPLGCPQAGEAARLAGTLRDVLDRVYSYVRSSLHKPAQSAWFSEEFQAELLARKLGMAERHRALHAAHRALLAAAVERPAEPRGDSPLAGPGTKRKLVDTEGPEAARQCTVDFWDGEAAAGPEVEMPEELRPAILEGLRRVLLSSRLKPDPTRYWADKGTGGPFPFPEQLSEVRRELGVERAPSV